MVSRRSDESPVVLNLGCGYQTNPRCVNIDWSIPIRLKGSRLPRAAAWLVLGSDRYAQFRLMSDRVLAHDLRRGIPFADESVDAVYHSHLLEHLDRSVVPVFFAEVKRVLRPGGVHRIVVPDLERDARSYLASLESAASVTSPESAARHEAVVSRLIEQMVRREAHGTSMRSPARRWIENRILGDARRRGETHQWMWDRVSLPAELADAGFREVQIMTNTKSRIPGWTEIRLDEAPDGSEYKPGSLYVEAVR